MGGTISPEGAHISFLLNGQEQRVDLRPGETLLEVLAFICIFCVCLVGGTFAVTLLEGDATVGSAFGATLSCLANIGPAPFHQGADNFAAYGELTKVLFSVEMVLGRLEFLTLLALGLPQVWRP